jgi:hypothetical protein
LQVNANTVNGIIHINAEMSIIFFINDIRLKVKIYYKFSTRFVYFINFPS